MMYHHASAWSLAATLNALRNQTNPVYDIWASTLAVLQSNAKLSCTTQCWVASQRLDVLLAQGWPAYTWAIGWVQQKLQQTTF